jgi:hypothetical protein
MSPKIKVFLFQFITFAIIFIPLRYFIAWLVESDGFWVPFTAFAITVLIAPKFQVVQTKKGTKIWMKFIFSKQIKEF